MSAYSFKSSPYSSHGLLVAMLPDTGMDYRVLDVGCGNAYLAEVLARRGYRVTAMDKRENLPHTCSDGVVLIPVDLDEELPQMSERFDYVVCADVLEHLRDPLLVLSQLRSYLTSGGQIVASLPNSGNIYFRWTVLRGRFPTADRGLFDRTHLHFYTWKGWKELFRTAGLRIEQVHSTAMPFELVFSRWMSGRILNATERLSFELARLWKTLFAYQFIVSARLV